MARIHPTAIIDASAQISDSATIGAYCIVGAQAVIGDDTELLRHVVVAPLTKIGARNVIYQFASIGEAPQDLKYRGELTCAIIGDDNSVRESCTIHRGTIGDKQDGTTRIGNHNLFMVNTHIAHDCVVGNHNVIANNVGVAGHVVIGNHVVVGGNTGIHQFCRLDDYCMTAGASLVLKDVAAFVTVAGNPAKLFGLNSEGMRRKGWSEQTMQAIEEGYDIVFRRGLIKAQALEALAPIIEREPLVALFMQSLTNSNRGLVR